MSPTQRAKLLHALTAYDIKQSKKRGHNPYALAHYCRGIQTTANHCDHGAELRIAILNVFTDRLLDIVLKALDLPTSTIDENKYGIFEKLPDCYICRGSRFVNGEYCPNCNS